MPTTQYCITKLNKLPTFLIVFIIFILFIKCKQDTMKKQLKSTDNLKNELIHSTSPYLLQHADNPVHWKEWSKKTLEKAKSEDKPILVSIGYSSCHWCHVMEKESFGDPQIAALMNENFINIKVDREERPDVDHLYMDAVQAMGLRGGWPLNVFLTPDQQPFYGGTYFPKKNWSQLLNEITKTFASNRDQLEESAQKVTSFLQKTDFEKYFMDNEKIDHVIPDTIYKKLSKNFDKKHGGFIGSPKFPMPTIWMYLAAYSQITENQEAKDYLLFTLEKIANGGIYDHIGGGFARYSTDEEWHVPHFEKMLYDNAQLMRLFAIAYKISSRQYFKNVLEESIEWLNRDMLNKKGGFYAAIDADSEGIEGKYYVWSSNEISSIAQDHFKVISDYFDVKPEGNWEDTNVLRIVKSPQQITKKYPLTDEQWQLTLSSFKEKALTERKKRIKPKIDNKIIAGWNGLTLSGLCETYQATQNPSILKQIKIQAQYIKNNLIDKNKIKRFPNNNTEGFLEDYAAVIQSFIIYYETTFEIEYLMLAKKLLAQTINQFYDEKENLFYFSSQEAAPLITKQKELFDNVIPSSNSLMAWNLIHLGTHFADLEWTDKGKTMISQITSSIAKEPRHLSNWASIQLEVDANIYQFIVLGNEYQKICQEINNHFIPNKIICGSKKIHETHPLFQNKKIIEGQTTIYICEGQTCQPPVFSVTEVLAFLNEN